MNMDDEQLRALLETDIRKLADNIEEKYWPACLKKAGLIPFIGQEVSLRPSDWGEEWREGPCPKCNGQLRVRGAFGGRGTFYCKDCKINGQSLHHWFMARHDMEWLPAWDAVLALPDVCTDLH